MKQPAITVGVPTLNSENRIAKCLDNLLAQTFTNYEIIVSVNTSTDRTYEICNSYANEHANITVYSQAQQLCMRDNFRFLVDKAITPYFHWRADDDLSSENFLAELYQLLQAKPTKKLATCLAVDIRVPPPHLLLQRLPSTSGSTQPKVQ